MPSPSRQQPPLPIVDSLDQLVLQVEGRLAGRELGVLDDPLEHLDDRYKNPDVIQQNRADIALAKRFLWSYKGSSGTFNSYRREIERLLQWCILISHKNLKDLRYNDIEAFVSFCQKPPKTWISVVKPPRFIVVEGTRCPNPAWRPFTVTVPKAAHKKGVIPDVDNFDLSSASIQEIFAILSSFFAFLLQEEYVSANPVALVRQKSKFLRKVQGQPRIRRLSDTQWHHVITTAADLATMNANQHERTLFIMSALYSMYLRISELAASERWVPSMNHFQRDGDGNWWFTTVGKGNKERQIAVSDAMLDALKRWRSHLGLSPFPSPADTSPLLPKVRGRGAMQSTNHIRSIVQYCFDQATASLLAKGLSDEAATLQEATVHWLRHTGISDDVKIRPREHVRDDAGHSSGAITDRYIDIELKERHRSARGKTLC